ncbi:MAG TPA: YwqG family protein [Acidimicrobiales bacterium]|nr:YwqG family protein [Acidimicrobiales bacterium]
MTDGNDVDALRERLEGICRRHLSPGGVDLVTSLARPAIRLRHADAGTRSHLGGAALLEHPDRWPRRDDRPLALVAVLDLEELSPFASDLDLPPRGTLNLFYDDVEQPWGFRPEDRGGWRVVLSAPDSAELVPAPVGVEAFVSIGLRPAQTLTIPGWEEPVIDPVFPPHQDRSAPAVRAREAFDSVAAAWDAVVDRESVPNHQVGGWPRLQQAPIWQECDIVSRGFPLGTSEECQRARAQRDPSREQEWQLLLQLDTDEGAGWMWGDVGTLFFAARRSVPVPVRYDEAWLVLQCG